MYYNRRRVKEHNSLKTMLLMGVCLVIAVAMLFTNVRTSLLKNSYLYIKAIETSIPYFGTSVQADNNSFKNISLRDSIYDKISSDIVSPSKLLSAEIPFLNIGSDEKEYEENFATINPFNLSDAAVAKINPEELQQQQGQQPENQTPVKVSAAFNPNLKKQLNESKPEILIYHTHTTEAYKPAGADSTEEQYSVVGVGTQLEKELENYGISVIHDKTMHSMVYNDSYLRSAETVKKYLNKYGNNFKLIIDLHRDSAESKSSSTINLNGENVSKMMFVTAQNTPYYQQNNAITESLNETARKLFPGFSKGILSYKRGMNSFNQNLSNHSILIEIGSDINSSQESQGSAKYVARVIAEYLNGKK